MWTLTTRSLTALFVCILASLLAACGSDEDPKDFDAGMLGTVEMGPGEIIETRTPITHSVETELVLLTRRTAEITVSD